MPWGGQINNGPCGFLMECCNYFLPLQLKCNSILPIYHLYDSDKKHLRMFAFLLMPNSLFASCITIPSYWKPLWSLSFLPLTAWSGDPVTLALKNGDGKLLPSASFILGSSWLLFELEYKCNIWETRKRNKNNLRGRLFLELYCLILYI